ncbi:MAG: hypothetical protein AB7G93_03465 [Bdellovibrionales bacterium]
MKIWGAIFVCLFAWTAETQAATTSPELIGLEKVGVKLYTCYPTTYEGGAAFDQLSVFAENELEAKKFYMLKRGVGSTYSREGVFMTVKLKDREYRIRYIHCNT